MPYQTNIPAALKAQGLKVELVKNWQTRGSSAFNPRGVVNHWTAGPPTGDRPSLRICIEGRPDLPGPLCNVFLTRGGVAVVVAAGRANHAGSGGWKGLKGNSSVFGIEAENSGGGEWTTEQRWSYPRINAALCKIIGVDASMVCGHNEWAPGRKIDPHDWPMPAMRAQTQAILNGSDGIPAPRPLDVDGVAGLETTRALQTLAGTPRDGVISGQPQAIRTSTTIGQVLDKHWPTIQYGSGGSLVIGWVQNKCGVKADRYFGRQTATALQRKLGVTADGIPGRETVKALQRAINNGTF